MPQIINGTWADAAPGQWILNEDEMVLYEILDAKDGWLKVRRPSEYERAEIHYEARALPPQRPDLPVILVVPTLTEAQRLVSSELGGQVVKG